LVSKGGSCRSILSSRTFRRSFQGRSDTPAEKSKSIHFHAKPQRSQKKSGVWSLESGVRKKARGRRSEIRSRKGQRRVKSAKAQGTRRRCPLAGSFLTAHHLSTTVFRVIRHPPSVIRFPDLRSLAFLFSAFRTLDPRLSTLDFSR
jgi:hypothetical protein